MSHFFFPFFFFQRASSEVEGVFLLLSLPISRDELQDVPEGEIESNWDQVVDKCVAMSLRSAFWIGSPDI